MENDQNKPMCVYIIVYSLLPLHTVHLSLSNQCQGTETKEVLYKLYGLVNPLKPHGCTSVDSRSLPSEKVMEK